jgi:hypothetical protein
MTAKKEHIRYRIYCLLTINRVVVALPENPFDAVFCSHYNNITTPLDM